MDLGPFLFLASLEGLVTASVLALTALGLSLVFGVMRVVNVAHGEFFMLGAIIAWWTAATVPGPAAIGFIAALVLAPLLVGAIAAATDWFILKRINYNPEATIVATIGLLYMIQQATLTIYGPDARPVEAPIAFRIQFPWFGYSGYKIVVIGFAIILLTLTWLVLTRSKIGLLMRATQYDRETAQAFGIPVETVYAGVFAVGAMLAAVGAILIVPIRQAHYLMGGDPLLLSFVVVIIGGLGSLRGTLAAALIIGLSDGIISVFFTPILAKIVATLLVACVLIWRPQGTVRKGTGMSNGIPPRTLMLHLVLLAIVFALQFVLPPYHSGIASRIMVLSIYAIGYNIAFGYTGLLSLGHAMFFSAGMYGAGMTARLLEFAAPSAFAAGLVCAALGTFLFGLMALRTAGVAFMIVTLMFSQAAYLVILYFNNVTRGDEGFVIDSALRQVEILGLDLANPVVRYNMAFLLLAICLLGSLYLVTSSTGRVMIAIRENEERTRMLGNNVYAYKLFALTVSGTFAGAAGAAYALLFGYTGAAFAEIQYSILPLLWTLVGGAGTTLGPIFGTALMFYLVDIASEFTSAYLFFVGLALVLMILWLPKGVLGAVRERAVQWLP